MNTCVPCEIHGTCFDHPPDTLPPRPLVANSGRFSCTEPNLQQVPGEHAAPSMRASFTAPPGRVLAVVNYAQIESRLAYYHTRTAALRAEVKRGLQREYGICVCEACGRAVNTATTDNYATDDDDVTLCAQCH